MKNGSARAAANNSLNRSADRMALIIHSYDEECIARARSTGTFGVLSF
ncbi:MAG: hypothetical protein ABR607_08140 [Pyrinomonadaceae bacterium]